MAIRKSLSLILVLTLLFVLLTSCNGTTAGTTTTTTTTSTVTTTNNITTTVTMAVTNTVTSTLTPAPGAVVDDLQMTIESVYETVNPSVVFIDVTFTAGGEATGSGFVWDKNGNIVTNNHVVEGAENIQITFSDGTIVDGTTVGTDVDSDLAVVHVDTDASRLIPVTMADSTQLKVGQLAVAIGNPYGYQHTLTVGYISGLGRLLPVSQNTTGPNYSIPDVIQTDAAINPGNSGGVLVDANAKVMGVTSSIVSASGSSSGVGFAIPSAIVQQVVPSLISNGSYPHPYLGISVISLTPEINAAMNLPADQRGALVETVTPGSPAEQAGLLAGQTQITINGGTIFIGGDVITAYNGQVINDSGELITILARTGSVGQSVTLTILRDGQQMQIEVTLGARPSNG